MSRVSQIKIVNLIENVFKDQGINAKIVELNVGPEIFQYCLKITSQTTPVDVEKLRKQIKEALSIPMGFITIEYPIPGRHLVGVLIDESKWRLIN